MSKHYTKSLDQSLEVFQDLLHESSKLIIERYAGMEAARAYPGYSPEEVRSWFNEPIPQQGMENNDLLKLVKARILDTATLNFGPPSNFSQVRSGR